jgi:SIR2-like domain
MTLPNRIIGTHTLALLECAGTEDCNRESRGIGCGSARPEAASTQLDPQAEIDLSALGHARMVTEAMLVDGQVVPLLGAGANLCGRPADETWRKGQYLPNGAELAAVLARKVPNYPPAVLGDLLRVAQTVGHKRGWKALYTTLHELFDDDYPPTELHRFLAGLPALMASLERPPREPHLLVVSTNYDDVLERAFAEVGEPYDLVWYVANGEHIGKFMHKSPDAAPVVIDKPDEYVEPLNLAERSVVLKIHGAVDRPTGDSDSYVITEDHYIDYLTRTDIRRLIPKGLLAKLRASSILFLGYSMRDWNLRAIFRRIWQEERLGWKSWAIRRPLDPLSVDERDDVAARERRREAELAYELENAFWDDRGVDILDVDLSVYTRALRQAAQELADEVGRSSPHGSS